jgi:hypothetical protein
MLGKPYWQSLIFSIVLFGAGSQAQGNLSSNGESVMNAFIATFAKEEVDWRSEVEFVNSPSDIPPGKQLGYSNVIGYFTFRPKTWEQLSIAEKERVMDNPKLKAFLISLRSSSMPQYTNQVRRGLRVSRNVGAADHEESRILRESNPESEPKPTPAPSSAPTPTPTPKPTPNIQADKKDALLTPPPPPAGGFEEIPPVKNFTIDAEDLVGNPDITIQLQ